MERKSATRSSAEGLGSVARRNRNGREKKGDTQQGTSTPPTPRLAPETAEGEEQQLQDTITQLGEKLQVTEAELAKSAESLEVSMKEKEALEKAMEEEQSRHRIEA